jgi:hypothetical protein
VLNQIEENMKRAYISISIFLLLIILPSMGTAAVYNPGTYKLSDNDFGNGSWFEHFPDGEGSASGDNVIVVADQFSWHLTAHIIDDLRPIARSLSQSSEADYYQFRIDYRVIFGYFGPGNWGPSFSLANVPARLLGRKDFSANQTRQLAYALSTSGIIESYLFDLEVIFDSISGSGQYFREALEHRGENYEEITLTVTPVPVPGVLWLLGSGVLCLIGLNKHGSAA